MNNIFLALIGINSNYKNKYSIIAINISFLIFIFSCLPFFYGIYNIFKIKTIEQILQCILMLNDILLYGNLKFSKDKIIYINKFYDEEINPKVKNIYLYYCFISSFILSIGLCIFYSIMSLYNYNFILIEQLYSNNILKFIATFSYVFYSSQIRLYSIIIFFVIFYTLSIYVRDCQTIINRENFSIPTICQQFIEIRHKYGASVKNLNIILSSNISCNFISVYLMIINLANSNSIDMLTIRSSIYFFLSIIAFHFIITNIYDNIDEIKSIIDNNRYIRLFLERKKETYNLNIELSELNNYNINELNFKNYLLEIENGDSIDWMILNNVTNQKWKSFEVFGFELNNNDIIIKLLSLLILLLIGKSII